MSKWFKRQPTKNVRTTYNYKPQDSLSEQEKVVYRRLALIIVLILIVSGVLYFWGIEVVARLSNLWQKDQVSFNNTTESDNKEPVLAPRVEPLPEYTNQEKIDVKGWAQPGAEVKIFLNDQEVTTLLTDKSGRFEYTSVGLSEGDNTVYAKTIFNSQESPVSDVQKVIYDHKPPTLEVSYDETNLEKEGKLVISGKTETDATIFVNDHRVILQADGNFNYTFEATEGENTVIVKSIDQANNESKKEKKFEYHKSTEETPAQ